MENDPFRTTMHFGEASKNTSEDTPSPDFDVVRKSIAAAFPELGGALEQFSPEEFSELDKEVKSVGNAWGVSGLSKLREEVRGPLDINPPIFAGYLNEWVAAWRARRKVANEAYADSMSRLKIARNISNLIENA
jgi:hypothetical protein